MVTSTARSRNKNIEAIYPLTPLQQGMLFHTLLESETGVYVQQLSCTLHGALDTEALERAWQRVVERHSVLRTAFIWEELKQSLQVVGRKVNLPLEQQDWRELSRDEQEQRLEAFLQQERRTGFKLSKSPLMRLNLIRTAADVHQFVLTYHHLLLDGWSLPILLKEVFSFYEAFRRGQDLHLKQTRPYVDYINWLQQQDETKAEGFWRATLKGFLSPTPLGEKPLATASQASREEAYSAEKTHLSRALTASLQALARQHQLTMSTLVQGAWAVLLARYSGQRDVLFGATTSGRPATLAGAEAMVGLFINTLPVRVEVNSEKEVVAWLKQLQHELVEMREHEHSALIQIHGWSEVPRGLPLFDSILVFQNYPLEESLPEQVGSLSIRGIRTFDQTNYALTLAVTPGAQMSLELAYDCRRFDAATIRRLLGHLQTVLEGMAANPERKLARLPLLTPAEEQQLAQWNRTQKNYPLEKCLHELFEAQAASTPLAIAARCEGRQLTYGELNGRANQLANYLRRLGVGADVLVGICAERSLDFVVGMLGVFKAGGAYVPLDPAYPKERLSFLLENSRVTILLTQQRLLDALPEHGATVVCLDADWAHVAHESEATLESVVVPANLAYVIYTSGSTGLPKGAMIEHRSMLNHLFIKAETLGLSSGDVVAQTASQCFDISVWQMLSVLLAGGRVEIFPDEVAHDPWLLAERVTQTGVTVLESVPSFLRILVEQGAGRAGEGQGAGVWGSLRWMLATGEALPPQLCRQWLESYPSIPLVNAYGPTECGDDVTQAVIIESPGEDVARMPIGRALSNLQLYVLDAEMRELPVGCSGELYVGGVGVGRGYLRDGGRTAERFVPDAFGGAEGARLYRTGDVVRRREDGELEYLGRVDEQVKVRGNRIELGEVEAALEGLEEVREAVALVWDEAGGSRLVAYVVPKAQAASPVEKEGAPKELEKVAQWQTVFDQVYRQETVSEQDEAVNLSVWISSYTRESLPENEIAESVEDSVKRILSLGPRRVLELGCGTGLLLSRIAPHCEYYCGTDISEAVVESLKRRLERSRASLPEIKLLQRAADDLEGIEAGSFDVVVINELVQYLPSADYLVRVIEGALKMLRPGGCIFVGGVRSLPLLEAFHLSVQLAQSTPDASVEQLQQRVRKAVAQDKELVIDPDFFIALKQRTPQISDVEIQLKGGEHDNELTKFRYDVILRAGQESVASTEIDWLDWRRGGLNVDDVRRMLREDEPPLLAVKNVPNLRLVRESRALELLSASARPATVGELKELVAGTNRAIAPASFWAIGEELPYDVQVCWSEAGEAGSYDLLFRRRSVLAHNAGHVALPRKSLEPKPWAQYANNPLLDISTEQLIPKLRRRMKETLPDYMIPSAFVLMDALPLTTNGKVDRRQLPAPEQTRPEMEKAYVAPRNSTEEKLSAICAEALRLERVGVYDNFFELGGHSLLAIQVLSRVQKTFQIDLPLRAVFETPTIAGLAQKIEEALSSGQAVAATPIERVARDGELELSHAQQRLWILDQLEPGSSFYNIPGAVRLTGQLKVEVLERSFSEIIRRHETLRTTFVVKDGKPLQHISQAEPRELAVIDIAGLPGAQQEEEVGRLATAEAERPFDLAQGPLLRMKLLRLSEEEHVLLVTMHHIISDGWSMGVLIREVAALYEAYSAGEASPLPELEIQYADYAAWQRKWLAGEMLQEQLRYWKGQLAGAPPLLELPTDKPRPAQHSFRGANLSYTLPAELADSLNAFSQRQGVTLFMTMLAALKILLFKWTGQTDIVVGTVTANRNRMEVEPLIGCFMNFLALRSEIRAEERMTELLGRLKATVLEAYAHQECPFEKIVEAVNPERRANQNPLYNVGFLLQNFPRSAVFKEGLKASVVPLEIRTALLDLRIVAEERPEGIELLCEYDTDLFEAETIHHLVAAYQDILELLTRQPEMPVSRFELSEELEARAAMRQLEQTIAITSTFTAEPLEKTLAFWMQQLEMASRIEFAPYNQVFQQLLDPSSRIAKNRNGVNVVLVRLEDWQRYEGGSENSNGSLSKSFEKIERNARDLVRALQTATEHSSVPYLVCLCPASPAVTSDAARSAFFERMEGLIENEVETLAGVYVVKSSELMTTYPVQNYDDPQGDKLGHIPYLPALFTALGTMIARKIHALKNAPYKVVVVDCDGTLWDGICGEDGAAGISLDPPRRALQEFLLTRREAGMLICLCSKNHEEDVREVFRLHSEMPLTLGHIAGLRINWKSKSENIRSLAQELQLGLDSFIVIDDNPVECAEIQAHCPEALTLQLPESPGDIPKFLRHTWAFDHLKSTAEDRDRTSFYQQNMERERLRQESLTFADFVATLSLEVEISEMEPHELSRVAQLTQRTNQFNCTGISRSESEIKKLCRQDASECLTVHVRDRFGEYGLVGVLIYANGTDSLEVDTFLLSCRVLGRGVEHRMLAALGDTALARGLSRVCVRYVPTGRNQPALAFLRGIDSHAERASKGGRLFTFASEALAGLDYDSTLARQAHPTDLPVDLSIPPLALSHSPALSTEE